MPSTVLNRYCMFSKDILVLEYRTVVSKFNFCLNITTVKGKSTVTYVEFINVDREDIDILIIVTVRY